MFIPRLARIQLLTIVIFVETIIMDNRGPLKDWAIVMCVVLLYAMKRPIFMSVLQSVDPKNIKIGLDAKLIEKQK